MSTPIPRLVHLLFKHVSVCFITVKSRDNLLLHMFPIFFPLAHGSLASWRKCHVQEVAGKHFSWKKEVMFFYFIVHELTSKVLNSFQVYEITKFKNARGSFFSDQNDVIAWRYRQANNTNSGQKEQKSNFHIFFVSCNCLKWKPKCLCTDIVNP